MVLLQQWPLMETMLIKISSNVSTKAYTLFVLTVYSQTEAASRGMPLYCHLCTFPVVS